MYPYQMTISADTPEALRQRVQNWLDSQDISRQPGTDKEQTTIQADSEGSYQNSRKTPSFSYGENVKCMGRNDTVLCIEVLKVQP